MSRRWCHWMAGVYARPLGHGQFLEMSYRVAGSNIRATPLVMIPGLSGTKQDWHEMLDILAQDRMVLTFDPRSMGESSHVSGPYTIEDMAEDCMGLVRHQGWNRVFLMGASMGGMVAQHIATLSATSQRMVGFSIQRLVLACTAASPAVSQAFLEDITGRDSALSKEEAVARVMRHNFPDAWIERNPERFNTLVMDSLKCKRPHKAILDHADALNSVGDRLDRLSSLSCPTLIVHGEDDAVVPIDGSRRMVAALEASGAPVDMLSLPGCGHLFWDMDEGTSAHQIRQFLAATGEGGF